MHKFQIDTLTKLKPKNNKATCITKNSIKTSYSTVGGQNPKGPGPHDLDMLQLLTEC